MKPIIFCILLSFSFLAGAQKPSAVDLYQNEIQSGFSKFDDPIAKTNKILDLAILVAKENNIQFRIEKLTTDVGQIKTYPALRILPQGNSTMNQEALELEQNWGGLKLYLSPYDLKRSNSSAFFDHKKSIIGVPYSFIYNELNEAYLHEKLHAETYRKAILKIDDTFAGSFKLLMGEQMSPYNSRGYFNFASLDEIVTTEFSVKENIINLYSIFKKSSKGEFLKNSENDKILSEIQFSLENLIGLSRQTKDLLEQAIKKIEKSEFKVTSAKLKLGDKLSAPMGEVTIFVNSAQRVFTNGSGKDMPVDQGTKIILFSNDPSPQGLISRLNKIINYAQATDIKYSSVLKNVAVKVMYADLINTNIEKLRESIDDQPSLLNFDCSNLLR